MKHITSDIQTGNDVLSFAKILFMVIINACLLRSVNFVWKISKSSPLLQLHGTSDIQTGNDVLSFAKILFMVIINACTRKWCSDDYKVKVGGELPFCQSWGFPDLKKISSDLFLPTVESIDADISNGRLRSLTTSLINKKVYFTHQILTKIFQQ